MPKKKTGKSAAETREKTTTKADRAERPRMYVGPTIPTLAIQNRVYTDIPETAKVFIAKDPEIGNLFIEVAEYPKANKMLRDRTGYIFSAYQKALQLRK